VRNRILLNFFDEFRELLCKPKILPLKSLSLERIQELEKEAAEAGVKLQK